MISLTSALDGGEWSASLPGRFAPRERAPHTHWIGGYVSPRNSEDKFTNSQLYKNRYHILTALLYFCIDSQFL